MKVSVLGTGSFGSAVAQMLTDNDHEVLLWTNDTKQIEEINTKHTNKQFYDYLIFDEKVHAINRRMKKINCKKIFLNMSKGIDFKDLTTISETIQKNIHPNYIKNIYSMTGPTFASELIERKLSKFVLASENLDDSKKIKNLFQNEYIIIETTNDIKGIEILSSVKNIIALAAGIADGLGYKDNTHAIIITEGVQEMMKLSLFYSIQYNTILSPAGIGDLVLTASSTTSRNYITGKKVGEGQSIKDAVTTTKTVVEGIECAKSVYKLSKKHKIDLPITQAVYNIFYKGKNPKKELFHIFK